MLKLTEEPRRANGRPQHSAHFDIVLPAPEDNAMTEADA